MDLKQIWKTVLGEIEVDLGKYNFGMYFRNSQLLSLEKGVAKIGFPNQVVAKTADQRYYSAIQAALSRAARREKLSLVFEVDESLKARGSPLPAGEEIGPLFETPKEDRGAVQEAIKHAGLRPDFILEEFCVSTSNQLAFAAAQAVIAKPGKNYNPLFLWGGVGVGKTHLMQAIGHEILRKNPSARVVYAPGEQFTNEIIQGIRKQSTVDFKEKYRSADALLIDDIQFLSGKDTAQEEFFHTFNAVQQHEGQIVMTSDRTPREIKDLADRLRSRFEGGLVADISIPDSELKTAICLLKAKKRGVELSTTVAAYLANNVDNVRSLDGALQLIISKRVSSDQEITLEFVAEILKIPSQAGVANPAKQLDARTALDEICRYFGTSIKLIKGAKRDRAIAQPRQILMFLLKKHSAMTLEEIAAFIGGRDHTTVMHGVEKIDGLFMTSNRIKKEVSDLRQSLGIQI